MKPEIMKPLGGVLTALALVSCTAQDDQSGQQVLPEAVEVFQGDLQGVMLNAGDKAPMVLMIPGSGPTDRDGNGPNGLNTNAYKLLAEGLQAQGISTVRVDKRGIFSSAKAGDPNAVTVDLYAADYRGWIDKLTETGGKDCIFILGHSEGGLMASAAAIGRDDVCGLILVAAPGRMLQDVLEEQFRANPANAPLLDDALLAIDTLSKGEPVDTTGFHPALKGVFHEKVQGFLMSMMGKDPVELLRSANVRALVVQGGQDLQVSEEDANRLATVESAELFLLPDMNHVLKNTSANKADNLATYRNPDLPLSDGLVEAVSRFISGR
ncbi:MAG: alpha/beta hydrolase [Pseudomonadota bacterium]